MILAIDPGAKRLGWAILSNDPNDQLRYYASGIVECIRGDTETYQDYRRRAMKQAVVWFNDIDIKYNFKEVVTETLPVKGFNDMGQAYLALSVVSAVQGVATHLGHPLVQIGATTVKARVGGTNKATKVRVRNSVWQAFPALQKSKHQEWKKVFDESDAIAVGLAHLGYKRP